MKQIKTKDLRNSEVDILLEQGCLWTRLGLLTGLRVKELYDLHVSWDGRTDMYQNYLDIHTKKSGKYTNRIELTFDIQEILKRLEGKKICVKTIQRAIEADGDRLLNQKLHAHMLRKAFASRLSARGVDIVTLMSLMNHSDIAQTQKYIKPDESKRIVALSLMGGNDNNRIYILKQEIADRQKELAMLEHKVVITND